MREKNFLQKIIKKVCVLSGAGLLIALGGVSVEAAESYTVTDFGVNASDTESDNYTIQKVLNRAVGAADTVTIRFPAGDYYVDQALRVYSNTHIILEDGATIHRTEAGIDRCMLHNVDQKGAMDVTGGYNMSQNITVEGGVWDGGDTSRASDGADIIRFDHAENIVVKDCTIKNVYDCHLVELVGVKNGTITNCTLTGFTYRSGYETKWEYAREAIQIESAWTNNPSNMKDASSAWANGSVIDGTACENIVISGNQVIDMPCGIGQHHFTKNGKYREKNIRITNNILTCSGSMKACKTAITCVGMDDVVISGNEITGPYRFAVHINEADKVTVKANKVSDISYNGIMVDGGSKIVLAENTIKNVVKHAVSIVGGTVGSGKKQTIGILKNKITNCSENGISISGGTVSCVKGNTIKKIKNNGISIIKKAKVYYVTGNTLKGCKAHSIWSGSTAYKTKVKNNH